MFELYAQHTARASLEQAIDFDSYDRSWAFPQIIICLEVLTHQHLEIIHNFLEQRCCKIDDFYLLLIGHSGAAEFWAQYNKLLGRNSFQIIEVIDLPFGVEHMLCCANADARQNQQDIKTHWRRSEWYADFDQYQPNFDRDIEYHALYLPGRNNNSIELGYAKQYLACEMAALPSTDVDLNYDLPDIETLFHWVERINNWYTLVNIDDLQVAYRYLMLKNKVPIAADNNIFTTSRELYQNSFFTVVRETVMQQPYACIGEKTLRAFYYGQAVIPTTYRGTEYLRKLGFQFIPELDVDFDQEKNFAVRVSRMIMLLSQFIAQHSKKDLQLLLKKHRDLFRHNSWLARQLTYFRSE